MAVYAAFSTPRVARADEPALFGRMAVWLVAGVAVILLQKSSWWTYHMLLLYPPVGVLAARGLDLAVAHVRTAVGTSTTPAMITSLLLVIPVLAALAYPAGKTARRLYASVAEHGDLETYRRSASADYANAADAASFLDRTAPPGSIYVFGDPTIHLLTGRAQAIPLQGSAWDFYLPSHWQQLPTDLAAARPVWIFLEAANSVARRSPATMALLARDYRVAWDTPYGRWYALNNTEAEPAGAGR